jgi:predicted nucleic acid-binding protein
LIVVDTNLIAYLFLEGERTLQAERVLEVDSEWVAPLLWRSELCNVLASFLRKRVLTLDVGVQIIQEAQRLMQHKEFEVAPAHVLSLTAESGCSAYDCEFVSLAQNLNIALVTSDKGVLQRFPSTAISLEVFIS